MVRMVDFMLYVFYHKFERKVIGALPGQSLRAAGRRRQGPAQRLPGWGGRQKQVDGDNRGACAVEGRTRDAGAQQGEQLAGGPRNRHELGLEI